MPNVYLDKKLKCVICQRDFTFAASEQRYFDGMVEKGKWKRATAPTRCPDCRCRKIPMRAGQYVNDKAICEFVDSIETKKGYRRRADLVLRHLLEEVAECSAALWKYEEETELLQSYEEKAIPPTPLKIARELTDILFLAVWMADILGIDLNEAVVWRMKEVAKQYGVDDREIPRA